MDGLPNWESKQPKWVRLLGLALGFEIINPWARYLVLVLPLLALSVAGFLLGAVDKLAAAAVLSLGLAAVVSSIVYWFFELSRRRRVMLGVEAPRDYDATNPDLRDEIILICVAMFVLTPLLLQSLNGLLLDYRVKVDPTGIGQALGLLKDGAAISAEAQRLSELQSWSLYTVEALIRNLPMGDELLNRAAFESVIVSTGETDGIAVGLLQLLFGGLVLTVVFGLRKRVSRDLNDAIDSLSSTHLRAAALGPIAMPRLVGILKGGAGERSGQIVNALQAITEIAKTYPRAVHPDYIAASTIEDIDQSVCRLFPPKLNNRPGTKDLRDVEIFTTTICVLRLDSGKALIMQRLANTEEYVAVRQRILMAASAALAEDEMHEFLNRIGDAPLGARLTNYLARLRNVLQGNG
ncbi:MAG TPA: hypothetical protein DCL54_03815 [Alphaproteobacteria bacterium]|nr:hypothetical protein [Alphaproteobacteria bacterium]HAJ45691.1 hypothetical protein [Alphaproteobacteria bacterium]